MKKMTRSEYAKLKGVNKSTVTRWVSAGRLVIDADGFIDVDASEALLAQTESPYLHHQARSASVAADKSASNFDATDENSALSQMMEGADAVAMRLKRAMAKEREAKAEHAAIELDKLTGALVERSDVDFLIADFGATLRGMVENMPDRLAPTLAAHAGNVNALHASLRGAMHDFLNDMSSHMQRRAQEVLS